MEKPSGSPSSRRRRSPPPLPIPNSEPSDAKTPQGNNAANEADDEGDEDTIMSPKELLEKLQTMHRILLGRNQDHIITSHLARVHASGRRSRILDVGTGTGTWVTTLAEGHPYADVVGIDIDWTSFHHITLTHGNADFYAVDVTKELPWEDNTFDLIHVKSMLMDIPRYPDLIQNLSKILRPGGLLILVESELTYQCIEGSPSESLQTFSEVLRSTLAARRTNVDLPPNLDRPIADTGLFSAQFYFQEIGCPVGAYVPGTPLLPIESFINPPGSPSLQRVGHIQKSVLPSSLNRLVCHRIEEGPERTRLLQLIKECTRDLRASSSRYLQRLFAVYAYKKIPPPLQRHHTHNAM